MSLQDNLVLLNISTQQEQRTILHFVNAQLYSSILVDQPLFNLKLVGELLNKKLKEQIEEIIITLKGKESHSCIPSLVSIKFPKYVVETTIPKYIAFGLQILSKKSQMV